jgi:prepilin-type N-terminal cleavage/methylation domain-containing protein
VKGRTNVLSQTDRGDTAPSTQSGFSLLELMVAMLVTLIVSGAVFGLITAGQGAFRREPELTDRQQNIRVAMDLIQRDLLTAGSGLPTAAPFARVFTPGLDGAGPIGPSSARPAPYNGNSDFLEMLGADTECPEVPVDAVSADPVITTLVDLPQGCYRGPGGFSPILVFFNTGAVRWGLAGGVNDGAPAPDTSVTFAGAQPGSANITPWPGGAIPVRIASMQVVRYEIAPDLAANDVRTPPCLWRSASGGLDAGGAYQPAPAAAGNWQLVARGIEDMQVVYRQADEGVVTTPVAAIPVPPAQIVREVEVTLWARAIAPNLAGQTAAAGVPDAVRASLVSSSTPRAALVALRNAGLWN